MMLNGYLVGQRVIVNNHEIGTVREDEQGRPASFGIWIFLPSKGYALDFALTSVKPLPNGQL